MSKFKDAVINVVRRIPKGKVVSYGQVAMYVGTPRAARQVGWILNRLEEKMPVPWWRVVNNEGRISIKGSKYSADDQRKLLIREGVVVSGNLTFDISKYRFVPDRKFIRKLKLDADYLEMISHKLPFSRNYNG